MLVTCFPRRVPRERDRTKPRGARAGRVFASLPLGGSTGRPDGSQHTREWCLDLEHHWQRNDDSHSAGDRGFRSFRSESQQESWGVSRAGIRLWGRGDDPADNP